MPVSPTEISHCPLSQGQKCKRTVEGIFHRPPRRSSSLQNVFRAQLLQHFLGQLPDACQPYNLHSPAQLPSVHARTVTMNNALDLALSRFCCLTASLPERFADDASRLCIHRVKSKRLFGGRFGFLPFPLQKSGLGYVSITLGHLICP